MRKKMLYLIIGLLGLCTIISVSYAYYTISPSSAQNISTVSSFTHCLSLTTSSTVNVTGDYAIPISDAKALSSDNYRIAFTIQNSCSSALEVKVAFAPGLTNTLPMAALKYAIYEQSGVKPNSGTYLSTNEIPLADAVIADVAAKTADTVSSGYELSDTITLNAGSSKSYYVYTWIAEDEGGLESGSTMNKNVNLHLVLAKAASIAGEITARDLMYSNSSYTSCTNVECALDELYDIYGLSSPSGPTAYWFDMVNCTSSSPCAYGAYPGTPVATGAATNHNVYIGQDSSKYYTCATIQGHEVCLSQPYTQYGLEGHMIGDIFDSTQQTGAMNALLQAFNDAGINIDISNCRYYAKRNSVECIAGTILCNINDYGIIQCFDSNETMHCLVFNSGNASCDNGLY